MQREQWCPKTWREEARQKQYPHNSVKKRQEAVDNAARCVHQAYWRRNAHISDCEACKAVARRLKQYDSRGHF